jgi:hypothetical protein
MKVRRNIECRRVGRKEAKKMRIDNYQLSIFNGEKNTNA